MEQLSAISFEAILNMNRGIFLNLFEVSFPNNSFQLYAKEWINREETLDDLKRKLYPTRLFACEETNKLYLFGGQVSAIAEKHGFRSVQLAYDSSPKLTGRLINFAVARHLVTLGFEPQYRDYLSEPRNIELTDARKPVQRIENRINVFSSFRIQSVFLRLAGGLRFFILVKPRLRYQFSHSLEQIQSSVDCTGKYIRITCPDACDIADCPIYELKGRLAGRLKELVDQSDFHCRFPPKANTTKYVQFGTDTRTTLVLPGSVCEIEASTANISMIFAARFDKTRASKVISDLRVASGDLLPGNPRPFVNPEVGKKHWGDIAQLIEHLQDEVKIDENLVFSVAPEPVRAIEGGYIPDSMYYEDSMDEDGELDESDSDIF